MNTTPAKIDLDGWELRYRMLRSQGLTEPCYGGPLSRHFEDGDLRLQRLRFDNSPAALRLWNFLLSENDRLHEAKREGKKIIGVMKDLGTIPVLAYSLPNVVAFYPDGAWWIPCIMELSSGDLEIADRMGIDESFCPVRAMLGAFETLKHFPRPDSLICSAGATCDDFSAIAQRLSAMGWPILWWEIPHRRTPADDDTCVQLSCGSNVPRESVDIVRHELVRIARHLKEITGEKLDEPKVRAGIRAANRVRSLLNELRTLVFTSPLCPLPAIEMLIAEMLAIHYCSDRSETIAVLEDLLAEVKRRVGNRQGLLSPAAARIFWINPVADLRVMNLLEDCGGRLCGSDFMFCHALDEIPEDLEPFEALARMALADPMVGCSGDRARRVCKDARAFHAEAVIISRIPGASHCAWEGSLLRETIEAKLHLPVIEIEVPPICDAILPSLRTRIEALVETVKQRRRA